MKANNELAISLPVYFESVKFKKTTRQKKTPPPPPQKKKHKKTTTKKTGEKQFPSAGVELRTFVSLFQGFRSWGQREKM